MIMNNKAKSDTILKERKHSENMNENHIIFPNNDEKSLLYRPEQRSVCVLPMLFRTAATDFP